MSLLQHGNFKLHAGGDSWWRIDCDDMSDAELGIIARMIAEHHGPFNGVVCPKSHYGSAAPRLVAALEQYKTNLYSPTFILVDDVLTTGSSMEALRQFIIAGRVGISAKGYVIFARDECPDWVTPVFQCRLGSQGGGS
jgi:hypothetical protein